MGHRSRRRLAWIASLALFACSCIPPHLGPEVGTNPDAGADGSTGSSADVPVVSPGTDTGSAVDGKMGSDAPAAPTDTATGTADTAAPSPDLGTSLDTIPKPSVDIEVFVANNSDDAVWVNGNDERLSYAGTNDPTIEVGDDAEQGRIGLRFPVTIPRGSTIVSAFFSIYRNEGTADGDTARIEVFDTANILPFSDNHVHPPSGHGILWTAAVGGFDLGSPGAWRDTPNVAKLVQHVIDLPAWQSGNPVGFVVSPESLIGTGRYATFFDSVSNQSPPRLRVKYVPP